MALQELLRAEGNAIEGTALQVRPARQLTTQACSRPWMGDGANMHGRRTWGMRMRLCTPNSRCPLHAALPPRACGCRQVSAVDQAVELLGQSVIDMRAAHRVVLYSTPEDAKAVAAAVLSTDARADEVSRMARCALNASLIGWAWVRVRWDAGGGAWCDGTEGSLRRGAGCGATSAMRGAGRRKAGGFWGVGEGCVA